MSEETTPKDTLEEKKTGKLKEALDKGEEPAPKETQSNTDTLVIEFGGDLNISEEEKVFNQENHTKLIDKFEKLTQHVIGKDVEAKRTKILDEIKEFNEDIYEEEKDNKTINELEAILRATRKTNPNQSKRDVGATPKDQKSEGPPTQYDHIKKEFVSG